MSKIYIRDSRKPIDLNAIKSLNISLGSNSVIKTSTVYEFSRIDRFNGFKILS